MPSMTNQRTWLLVLGNVTAGLGTLFMFFPYAASPRWLLKPPPTTILRSKVTGSMHVCRIPASTKSVEIERPAAIIHFPNQMDDAAIVRAIETEILPRLRRESRLSDEIGLLLPPAPLEGDQSCFLLRRSRRAKGWLLRAGDPRLHCCSDRGLLADELIFHH